MASSRAAGQRLQAHSWSLPAHAALAASPELGAFFPYRSRRSGAPGRGKSVASNQGVLIVSEDMILKGEIRNCRQMEVYGYVEGDVAAQSLRVHQSGRCFGKVKTDQAEIHGTVQGEVVVKHLINIRSSGSVTGNVQYGQLAMEVGANLSAEVRNVPPSIAGDLDLTVVRGRSVPVTLEDLNAVDPDDDAKDLVFTVSKATNGFVTLSSGLGKPVAKFTQADLQGGRVLFKHDGTDTNVASFDVVVADHAGSTSGAPQTVKVHVRTA
jgi:cytoskeletal protein CcmA (bactofilin family)